MSKAKSHRVADIRAEYRKSDFPIGMVRGKYTARLAAASNVVILDPEIAAAFPTSKSVNDALGVVLQAAKSVRLPRSAGKRARKQQS